MEDTSHPQESVDGPEESPEGSDAEPRGAGPPRIHPQLEELLMARRRAAREAPRNNKRFRSALLSACRRIGFAQHARWLRVVGEHVKEGFSIGFVEQALALRGNMSEGKILLDETDAERTIEVYVSDDEAGVVYSERVVVSKTVKRITLVNGDRVVGNGRDARGLPHYLVAASPEEVRAAEALAVSLALRGCGLRHLPRDLRAECEAQIVRTLEAHAKKHLENQRATLITAFRQLGIHEGELVRFLGKPLGEAAPADLVTLWKGLSLAQESLASWRALVRDAEVRRARTESPTSPPSADEGSSSSFMDKLKRTPFARRAARESNGAASS